MKQEKKIERPIRKGSINTIGMYSADPMGSYTGIPADPEDVPVQDADDL